jgi:hypothetical protein
MRGLSATAGVDGAVVEGGLFVATARAAGIDVVVLCCCHDDSRHRPRPAHFYLMGVWMSRSVLASTKTTAIYGDANRSY